MNTEKNNVHAMERERESAEAWIPRSLKRDYHKSTKRNVKPHQTFPEVMASSTSYFLFEYHVYSPRYLLLIILTCLELFKLFAKGVCARAYSPLLFTTFFFFLCRWPVSRRRHCRRSRRLSGGTRKPCNFCNITTHSRHYR